jgi:hypothetical protein
MGRNFGLYLPLVNVCFHKSRDREVMYGLVLQIRRLQEYRHKSSKF